MVKEQTVNQVQLFILYGEHKVTKCRVVKLWKMSLIFRTLIGTQTLNLWNQTWKAKLLGTKSLSRTVLLCLKESFKRTLEPLPGQVPTDAHIKTVFLNCNFCTTQKKLNSHLWQWSKDHWRTSLLISSKRKKIFAYKILISFGFIGHLFFKQWKIKGVAVFVKVAVLGSLF